MNLNLNHLYLTPLEQCNLNCKICYTHKTHQRLTQAQLKQFINRYLKFLSNCSSNETLELVTLCGGEVFLLNWLPDFVNWLTNQEIIVEIITNGTMNCLADFKQPNLINIIVSLDGLPSTHDQNRGRGSFSKSWQFIKQALANNFHLEIFSVVTAQNFAEIEQFEQYFRDKLDYLPKITYHPRKNPIYLAAHPVSNATGATQGFEFLKYEQLQYLVKYKTVFPPLNLGCHQLAVMSNGLVYGCCEGFTALGKMTDDIKQLIKSYKQAISVPKSHKNSSCQGCAEPSFMCGLTQEYAKIASSHKESL